MKALFILITLIFTLSGCSTKKKEYNYPNKEVCFLLFHLKSSTFDEISNQKNCEKKLPAVSTFKIPLAVMAFDSEILKNEETTIKWDGKKSMIEAWNKDHTAKSWMHDSVIWYSQALTQQLGKEKIESYLKSFDFGNANMEGGLKYAWLTPAPFINEEVENSLKVSGYDQIHFLKNLWRGELKAPPAAHLKTIGLLPKDTSPNGNRLIGKTGSGYMGSFEDLRVGWWVGYLETANEQYVVVLNFTDVEKLYEKTFGGDEAKEMTKQLLKERGLW